MRKNKIAKQVGLQLKKAREEKGITQEILAGEAKMGRSSIAAIEAGRNIRIETLATLTEKLGMSITIGIIPPSPI